MIKLLKVRQFNTSFNSLNSESNAKFVIPLLVFLILNTLKVTIYNLYIIPSYTTSTFIYKFGITIIIAILIYPFFFKFKSFIPLLFLYILETIYITVNISYYIYYHNYLHITQMVTLFKEAFISAGHSSSPLSVELLISLIDLPVLLYIVFNYKTINKAINQSISRLRFKRISIIIFTFIVIMCIESINYAQGSSIIQYSSSMTGDESPIVERYGTLVNNVVNFCLSNEKDQLNNNLSKNKEISNKTEYKNKPNFIFIQVESMDSNIINQKYKGEYIAPYLHSLSGQCIYYPYVLSYHMGGGTSDSEFSIIDSIEPLGSYPAIKVDDYAYPNSFIKSLSNDSYHTVAYHGNTGNFYNRNTAFPKMGFNEFFDLDKMGIGTTGWGAPDNEVFNYAARDLLKKKQPFMSYIITMSSHLPFTNARNYYNNDLYDDLEDETVKNYFNSMSYVDQSIRDFVLKTKSEFKNTYIFIVGDHTPGIYNEYYRQASFSLDNRYFEFVPLFIITPDNKTSMENNSVGSFLDISPTILYASGIDFKIKSNGIDLVNSRNITGSIPFKGNLYDRKLLFSRIDILSH